MYYVNKKGKVRIIKNSSPSSKCKFCEKSFTAHDENVLYCDSCNAIRKSPMNMPSDDHDEKIIDLVSLHWHLDAMLKDHDNLIMDSFQCLRVSVDFLQMKIPVYRYPKERYLSGVIGDIRMAKFIPKHDRWNTRPQDRECLVQIQRVKESPSVKHRYKDSELLYIMFGHHQSNHALLYNLMKGDYHEN